MGRLGRPPGSGTGTRTAPGPCPKCGRQKVWKVDPRRAAGGYWYCPHRETGPTRGPRPPRQRPSGPRQPSRPRQRTPAKAVGTRRWLTDPTVPACSHDGCHWDAATCPVHRKN